MTFPVGMGIPRCGWEGKQLGRPCDQREEVLYGYPHPTRNAMDGWLYLSLSLCVYVCSCDLVCGGVQMIQ